MMSNEVQSKSGAIWPLALGVIAAAFGGFIPLPGVDQESLQALIGQGVGLWEVSVGPIGNTIGALLLAYAFALNSTRTWAWRAALVFYLACSLLQGLGIAFWLEGLNSGYGGLGGFDTVPFPGWGFRSTVMLAYAAGASILWFISKSIDTTKRATGALFLLLVDVFIDQLGIFSSYGEGFARGTLTWTQALPLLSMPVSMIILACAVYRRPNVTWPVTLWRWKLQSHIDVIALVTVSVLPGALARLGSVADVDPAWFDLIDALLALGLGVSASLWWWKLASADGTRGKPTKTLVAIGLAAFTLLGASGFAFVRAGGIERLTTPRPLAGRASFSLTLDAETQFETGDAETMVALLEALGANAEIVSSDQHSITLEVNNAIGRPPVLQALTPVRFRLSPVLDIQQNARPEVLRLGTPSGYGTAQYLVAECSAFEGLAGTLGQSPGIAGLFRAGCRFAVQHGEMGDCSLYCLTDEAVLTSGDVLDAVVTMSEYEQRPVVSVILSEDAALRFEDYTANHIQELIAIEVNDEVLSAPMVQSRIGGGRLQITLGQSTDLNTMLGEAEQLAAGLRPGGVQTPWRLRTD